MSGSQQLLLGGNPQAVPVDPYFYSVTSLLHGDGTNGGQNNTFLDSSSNNFTITRNGNTTQGSFSPFSQTGWGNYFDGTGDYLTATCNAISGAYTFEAWIYATTATVGNIYSTSGSGGLSIYRNAAGRLGVQTGSSAYIETIEGVLPANTWCHVAVTKNASNTYVMYVNGVSYPAVSTLGTMGSSYSAGTGQVGTAFNISANFTGYISNLRVVNGTQVYTSNFTPPTAPLTAISNTEFLTCQSNRFIDNSSNAFAITRNGDVSVQPFSPFNPTAAYSTSAVGGSGYFDGSGDYLTIANNSSQTLASNYTLEFWVYRLNGSDQMWIGRGDGSGSWGSNSGQEYLVYIASGTLYYQFNTGGGVATISTATLPPIGAWSHIAIARNGTTTRMWLNGVSLGTSTASVGAVTGATVWIGTYNASAASYYVNGYLSGIRFVQNTAVYDPNSSTITVPTAPLTAITNTSYLLNFTNGAIFDNAAVADYETVGNAQISTSVKKYGTGSIAFDGNGDYLFTPSNQTLAFGAADFTIEFWVYFNVVNTSQELFDFRPNATTSSASPVLYLDSGTLRWFVNGADRITSGALSASTWYHVAICRVASQTKLFVNGTQSGSTYADTTSYLQSGAAFGLNRNNGGSAFYYLNGYIDDLRISNGIGRYPYNFTPPTAEFPNIGGTVTLTADPYFDYTTLLLPGNGTNGAQNNTFLDSSTNAFSITRNGNTTQGTFSPFSQTGWGNYFDGSGDYLSGPTNNAVSTFTGDFTIESWCYFDSIAADNTIAVCMDAAAGEVGWIFRWKQTATQGFRLYSSAVGAFDFAYVPSIGQWFHVAISRSGTSLRCFVNGTQIGTTQTASGTIVRSSVNPLCVGGGPYQAPSTNGYLSNVRIVNGTAVYTANFTPPTTPLTAITNTSLLTCQSNRFIDNSSNNFAITRNGDVSVQAFSPFNPTASWSAATYGGSGYFDGSGDYLNTTSTQVIPSGSFTVEAWVYLTTTSSAVTVVAQGTSGNAARFSLGIESSLWWAQIGAATINAGTPVTNTWTHLAVTFNGSTLTLYVNGTSVGTASTSTNAQNTTLRIGSLGPVDWSTYYWPGYIGQVRISNTVRSISVPTALYTADANTTFLTNFTNAGIYDATSKNDLETVGNAQISTTQSKFGGSSMYFDGTGDYLFAPSNQVYNITSGDYTVEFWVRFDSASGTIVLFGFNGKGTTGSWQLLLDSGVLYWQQRGNGTNQTTYTWNPSTGVWYHVALSYYGSTFRMFINGNVVATNSVNPVFATAQNGLNIGGASDGYSVTGYIQDFRLTKGIARYTSNFTPPTTAFLTL